MPGSIRCFPTAFRYVFVQKSGSSELSKQTFRGPSEGKQERFISSELSVCHLCPFTAVPPEVTGTFCAGRGHSHILYHCYFYFKKRGSSLKTLSRVLKIIALGIKNHFFLNILLLPFIFICYRHLRHYPVFGSTFPNFKHICIDVFCWF